MQRADQELRELHEQQLLRQLKSSPHAATAEASPDFSSNDYLGLSHHPALIEAALEATRRWGTSARSSRLIGGTTSPHRALEATLAEAKGTDAAITFANGYATAVGTLPALMQQGDTIILDKLAHASLIDGARMSKATLRVYPHNHLDKLAHLLATTRAKSAPDARILIVTESVFSMDGDTAPLADIIKLKQEHDALLLLDEAHALGVYGPTGMGLAEALGLSSHIDLHMGTLGKAAGSAGGYIAASQPIIDLLINRARSLIYSTAPPPAQTAAAQAAIELIQSPTGQALRDTLWQHLHTFAEHTQSATPTSAIIPWIIGDNQQALETSQHLEQNHQIHLPAIRFPTVPRGTARLRITLHSHNTPAQIQHLTSFLAAKSH